MRLWTIQPLKVWKIIQKQGVYIADEKHMELFEYDQYKKAYDWMVKQMDAHGIVNPDGVSYPVWSWYKQDFKNKKPDLRKEQGYVNKGDIYVCLELEMDEAEVLLSDFDKWHSVLNNDYCISAVTKKRFL